MKQPSLEMGEQVSNSLPQEFSSEVFFLCVSAWGRDWKVRKLSVFCTHVIDFISCHLGHMGGLLSMLLKLVVAGVRLGVEPRTMYKLDECSALIQL
jgi:hypothetical protein